MVKHTHETASGTIHYWLGMMDDAQPTLVFLPGLTADHRLFDKQTTYFEGKCNVLVWDAPGHGASWPFVFDFDLADKARWLHEILRKEHVEKPVIVGQSMGGYVGQMFAQLYPDELCGFVSIDSAPLQRRYVTAAEIWLLKRMQPVYRHYPWKALLKSGAKGVAETTYGQSLMHEIMMTYDGDQRRYAQLAGHGYKMLAEGYERNLPCEIRCPALLVCGEKDRAGSTLRYNRAWHKQTNIPIAWIKDAGHNANTDQPETVNRLIEEMIRRVWTN